ncbi:MAG TPA: hypothetical protein VFH83_15500, partial [Spirochaetia bacterium]|nr:hypothetical protein [Spirochaetia bacterium]
MEARDSGGGFRSRLPIALTHAWPMIIIYAVFVVMVLILGAISPFFSSPVSVTNLFAAALPLAFAAMAQTMVVLVKGIDLSVGPTMSLVIVVMASLMHDSAVSIVGILLLSVALGLAIGVINGAFVVFARLQSIIVTLAMSSILSGIALYILPEPGGYVPEGLGAVGGMSFGAI